MDYVKELVKMAHLDRPTELPGEEDWLRIEAELGYQLPPDYKELISAFGSGTFGDDLGISNPRGGEGDRLSSEDLIKLRELVGYREETMNIRLFPHRDGLLSIGSNSNAMHIMLAPNGKKVS